MSKFLAGGERIHPTTPPHLPSPIRENPDPHSSLRYFQFQGNLYTMFVILDISFRVANIKQNLCQNTVKFRDQKSWILFTVSMSSVKQSDLGHFFRAQGKLIPPFPCTLFYILLRHKIYKLSSKKFFRSLYFTLLLYAIFYHFNLPFFYKLSL